MGLFDTAKVDNFSLTLSAEIYRPCEMVRGQLSFSITKPMAFRSICVKVRGKESTRERRSGNQNDEYAATNFFKVHVTLLGLAKKRGDEWRGELQPGNYNFPIAFRLPAEAQPSAYYGTGVANIWQQYHVKATIECPFAFDLTRQVEFVVVRPMPIAQAALAPSIVEEREGKRKTAFVFSRGTTRATIELHRCVVIFGKDTAFGGTVTINNANSKLPVDSLKISLIQQFHVRRTYGFRQTDASYIAQQPSVIATESLQGLNIAAGSTNDVSIPFQLSIDPNIMADAKFGGNAVSGFLTQKKIVCQRPATYQAYLTSNRYFISITSGGDQLARLEVYAASELDESGYCGPVQSAQNPMPPIPRGMYPRFLYAPPPAAKEDGSSDGASVLSVEMPPQKSEVGPFPGKHNLCPIPYPNPTASAVPPPPMPLPLASDGCVDGLVVQTSDPSGAKQHKKDADLGLPLQDSK